MPLTKPTFPEFGTDTPGMGSPDYVAPTGTQETDGFDGTAGEFVRGLVNWLHVQTYRALTWLDDTRFTWWHFDGGYTSSGTTGGGHIFPWLCTNPTTGAGLTGTSGAWVGQIGGRVFEVASAAKNYAASKDTYLDVDHEGTLTYVEVANLAAAPALTADSIRLGFVRTDGSDRTLWSAFDADVVHIEQPVYVGDDLRVTGGLDVDGDLNAGGDTYLAGALECDTTPTYLTPETVTKALGVGAFSCSGNFARNQSTDPKDASNYITKTAGAVGTAEASLELPQDAVITDATVLHDNTIATIKAAVVRRPRTAVGAGANLSTVNPTSGEALTGAANTALTLDASEATRTVDNATYSYALWVYGDSASAGRIHGASVTFTNTSAAAQ